MSTGRAGDDSEAQNSNDTSHTQATAELRPETHVPDGENPRQCPHCGFELPADDQFRLHLGLNHYDKLDDADQQAFRDAYQQEEAALTRFRIIALGGLVVLYFGFLLIYALLAT